jgi:hypothetical protein
MSSKIMSSKITSSKIAIVLASGMIASALSLAASTAPSFAQTKCDRVNANGDCVRERAAKARRSAVVHSQPRGSENGANVLPSEDGEFRYPNSLINDPNSKPTRVGRVPPPAEGFAASSSSVNSSSAPAMAAPMAAPAPAAAPAMMAAPVAAPPALPPPPMAAAPMPAPAMAPMR